MKKTDWRNMPGPGDEETWGPCQNHPNDPRTPDDDGRWEAAKNALWSKKCQDPEMLVEALSEEDQERLGKMLKAIFSDHRTLEDCGHFGFLIAKIHHDYCEPTDWEVGEQIELEDEMNEQD